MLNLSELLEQYPSLDRTTALEALRAHAVGELPEAEQAVNLVHALETIGDPKTAWALCERLTTERPDFAPGWARRSQLALARGQIDAAIEWSETACQKNPDCSFSRLNRGIALRAAGYVTEAGLQLSRALNIQPEHAATWSHYGLCLADQAQHSMALNALDNASRLAPDSPMHYSNRLMTGQYDPAAISQDLLEDARRFSMGLAEERNTLSIERAESIRVGYLSPDLYNHPVGRLFVPILEAHDRDRFEITVFSDVRQGDELTSGVGKSADHFVDSSAMSDKDLEALIAQQPVDVMVDLAGHTAGNRLPLFARRLAPVQVSWLGYAASTGLKNMDAVVLGEHHCTPATQSYFVEPILKVPGTHFVYQPPDYLPPLRHRPGPGIRFCSFNHTAKLNTEVLSCWADILKQVPDASLTLKWRSLGDPKFGAWLRARFSSLGIADERIILEPASTHPEMLERYNGMDIALDPFPYCGGLTTLEALSMGVPVVTMPWQRPISRQSAAVLKTLGFEQLIAGTPAEYVDIAVKLAKNPQMLESLRQSLRPAVENHLHTHAARVAAGLESIYAGLVDGLTL